MAKYKMKVWTDFKDPIVKTKSDNINTLIKDLKELKNKLK